MKNANKLPTTVALYRALYPASRAVDHFRFAHNSGCYKTMECIHCGAVGPRWASDYRKTKRAIDWECEHNCERMEDGTYYYGRLAAIDGPSADAMVRGALALIGGA